MRAHNLRNMYQIAVIGGNGFLGRSIIHRLSKNENLRIFSLDNKTHGVTINTEGYKAILQQIVMDVSNEGAINAWLMAHPVDVIIYCAGFEDISDGLGSSYKEDTKALIGLQNTLLAIDGMNLDSSEPKPFFLYVSSWAVYGPQKKTITEETKEYPANYFGMTRLAAEDLVKRLCSRYNAPFCIVRPTEVYGRKNHKELSNGKYWKGYLNYYLDKILIENDVLDVFSPDTKIDLIHVNHFSKVITEILREGITGIYNISSGNLISIRDLVGKILFEVDPNKQLQISFRKQPQIEDMNLSNKKMELIVPYDQEKYNFDEFLRDYTKIRRLEIAKRLSIESILSEPVILDPTAEGAQAKFVDRQINRKITYGRIKKIAGEEFFNLQIGNIVRRSQDLDKLDLPSLTSNESTSNIRLEMAESEDLLKPSDKVKKKKKSKKEKP